ncbi:MAG: hypothetical protein QXZ44_07330, partial [Ferroplasma sp.]
IIASIILRVILSLVILPISIAAYSIISLVFDLIIGVIWLYGIYIGYSASQGSDAIIPVLGDYAKDYAR